MSEKLVVLHHDAVMLKELLNGVAHVAAFATAGRDDHAALALEEGLAAMQVALRALALELEYESGTTTRPVEAKP